jgi:hypothetical protein
VRRSRATPATTRLKQQLMSGISSILGEIPVPVARPRDLMSKEVVEICNQTTELLGGLIG